MTWFLIIIAATGARYGGYEVSMHEFSTREKCEAVRQFIDDAKIKTTTRCVER